MAGLVDLVKQTFRHWSEDNVSRISAAMAYFMVFSLAPLLVIIIGIAGIVLGQEGVRGALLDRVGQVAGGEASGLLQTMIESAMQPGGGTLATIIGVVTLLFGATTVFVHLQGALNEIWGVERESSGIMATVKQRLLAFLIVLGAGLVLLVWFIALSALPVVGQVMEDLPIPYTGVLYQVLTWALTFALLTVLFAIVFKMLPDVSIMWRSVWVGAAVTSVLFAIGWLAISIYLRFASPGSVYGAAGSLVVVLVWLFYSAMIFFLGAEFTYTYAQMRGDEIVPAENATVVKEETRQFVRGGGGEIKPAPRAEVTERGFVVPTAEERARLIREQRQREVEEGIQEEPERRESGAGWLGWAVALLAGMFVFGRGRKQ